jgi:hypothetical protein
MVGGCLVGWTTVRIFSYSSNKWFSFRLAVCSWDGILCRRGDGLSFRMRDGVEKELEGFAARLVNARDDHAAPFGY